MVGYAFNKIDNDISFVEDTGRKKHTYED